MLPITFIITIIGIKYESRRKTKQITQERATQDCSKTEKRLSFVNNKDLTPYPANLIHK